MLGHKFRSYSIFPIELNRETPDQQLILQLHIVEDLFWFRGHFPNQPILPGVAQLDWVMHYARDFLQADWQLLSVENIKFQHPILPNCLLRLTLSWLLEKNQLTFSYVLLSDKEEINASNGKITLCR